MTSPRTSCVRCWKSSPHRHEPRSRNERQHRHRAVRGGGRVVFRALRLSTRTRVLGRARGRGIARRDAASVGSGSDARIRWGVLGSVRRSRRGRRRRDGMGRRNRALGRAWRWPRAHGARARFDRCATPPTRAQLAAPHRAGGARPSPLRATCDRSRVRRGMDTGAGPLLGAALVIAGRRTAVSPEQGCSAAYSPRCRCAVSRSVSPLVSVAEPRSPAENRGRAARSTWPPAFRSCSACFSRSIQPLRLSLQPNERHLDEAITLGPDHHHPSARRRHEHRGSGVRRRQWGHDERISPRRR